MLQNYVLPTMNIFVQIFFLQIFKSRNISIKFLEEGVVRSKGLKI